MPPATASSSISLGNRELVVLLLAVVAIIFSLSKEGAYELEESYLVKFDPTKWANKKHPSNDELLPPPIVTDIDGDGLNELVLITTNLTLRIYHEFLSEPDEPFSPPVLKKEVSLVPQLRAGHHGQHPIALVSGYLVPPKPFSDGQKGMAAGRAQHIVVVKDGGTVMCFDSKLRLQWESHMHGDQDTIDHHTKEVAAIITASPTRLGDQGTVLVGRRFQKYIDPADANHGPFMGWQAPPVGVTHQNTRAARTDNGDDEEETHAPDDDDHLPDDAHEHDAFESNHFSYYAFDGATGTLRWKHEAGDFENTPEEHHRLEEERAELMPEVEQHLQAHVKHLGEQDWTVFRDHMLAALPSGWAHRFDTRFDLAHFERGRVQGVSRAADRKRALPDAHSHSEHVDEPNVVLSYRQTGLEVIHFYTGRMLTQLPLAPGGSYADIDSDGLIERVRVREGVKKRGECIAVATTYTLQAKPLWNVSLCGSRMVDAGSSVGPLQAAKPLLLRREPRPSSTSTINTPVKYDSVFLLSSGLAASIGPRGRVRWTRSTSASWDSTPGNVLLTRMFDLGNLGGFGLDDEEKALQEKFGFHLHPSATAFSAKPHGHRDLILCLAKHLVLLRAADGSELASKRMQSPPLLAPVVGDLNHDGINDVVVTAAEGYFVFLMHKSVDYELLPLIISIVLLFAGLGLFLYSGRSSVLFGTSVSASTPATPSQRLKLAAD